MTNLKYPEELSIRKIRKKNRRRIEDKLDLD